MDFLALYRSVFSQLLETEFQGKLGEFDEAMWTKLQGKEPDWTDQEKLDHAKCPFALIEALSFDEPSFTLAGEYQNINSKTIETGSEESLAVLRNEQFARVDVEYSIH